MFSLAYATTGLGHLKTRLGRLKARLGPLQTGLGQLNGGLGRLKAGLGHKQVGLDDKRAGLEPLTVGLDACAGGQKQPFGRLEAAATGQWRVLGGLGANVAIRLACGFCRFDSVAVAPAETGRKAAGQAQNRQYTAAVTTPTAALLGRKLRSNTC